MLFTRTEVLFRLNGELFRVNGVLFKLAGVLFNLNYKNVLTVSHLVCFDCLDGRSFILTPFIDTSLYIGLIVIKCETKECMFRRNSAFLAVFAALRGVSKSMKTA